MLWILMDSFMNVTEIVIIVDSQHQVGEWITCLSYELVSSDVHCLHFTHCTYK